MMKNFSIAAKISTLFILVISILILPFNISLYFIYNGIFRTQLVGDLTSVMKENSRTVDSLVNSINQAAVYLCTDKFVADTVNARLTDPIDISYSSRNLTAEFENHIALPLSGTLANYSSNFFVDTRLPIADSLNADESSDSSGIHSAQTASQEDWYQKACEFNGSLYAFTLGDDKQTLYLARSVSNPYSINMIRPAGFMGVVVFRLDVSELGQQISSAKLTPSTTLFLTTEDGMIVYSKNDRDLQKNISRYIKADMSAGYTRNYSISTKINNQEYITDVNDLKCGWRLIAMIPVSDITQRLDPIRSIIVWATAIAMTLGIFLCLSLSRSITQPIKRLALTMKGIKSQDYFNTFVEPTSNDEVGMLYGSFNDMMRRINRLVEDLLISSEQQKNAEMKALQAQINPHFVYNTLDSISVTAMCDGNRKVVLMVNALANIMRFNIRDPDALVTISEELRNVKDYVSIQSLRYPGKFEVEYRVPSEVLNMRCPKLTLQPLVENSILHGLPEIVGKGTIVISGAIEGDSVVLSVSDNGTGTDVDRLNAYLNGEMELLRNSDGFGIKNIHRRIKLHFGDGFGLTFYQRPGGGTIAATTLPLSPPEDGAQPPGLSAPAP